MINESVSGTRTAANHANKLRKGIFQKRVNGVHTNRMVYNLETNRRINVETIVQSS